MCLAIALGHCMSNRLGVANRVSTEWSGACFWPERSENRPNRLFWWGFECGLPSNMGLIVRFLWEWAGMSDLGRVGLHSLPSNMGLIVRFFVGVGRHVRPKRVLELYAVCVSLVAAAAALLRYFYIVFKDKKVWKVCKERK